MRAIVTLLAAVACHACAPAAPLPVATPEPRAVVREDPRRALVEKMFAALAANDRKALMELADADNIAGRILACDQPAQGRRKAVFVRLHLAELAKRFGGQALRIVDIGDVFARTNHRRGERVDSCEYKVAVEYQELDVWARSKDREIRLRMHLVALDGQLYLDDAPRVVRPEGPADLALVDQLEALADRMCSCPDHACAEQAQHDLTLWTYAQTKAAGDEIVDTLPDSAGRQTELKKRFLDCRKQVP